jgi:hypothetical protein
MVDDPVLAVAADVAFTVTLPDFVTEVGFTLPVALPLVVDVENVTGPVNPDASVTANCPLVLPPGLIDPSDPPDPSVNGAPMFSVTVVDAVIPGVPTSVPVKLIVPPVVMFAGIVAMNVAVVVPAGTFTLLGDSTMPVRPLVGAIETAPVKPALGFTVIVIGTVCPEYPNTVPPVKLNGTPLKVMVFDPLTKTDPPCATPEKFTVGVVVLLTVLATVAVNCADVDPGATVIEFGESDTPVLEGAGVITTAPVNPAARFTVTVTVELPPGNVGVATTPRENPAAKAICTDAVCVIPLAVPVKVNVPGPVAVTVYWPDAFGAMLAGPEAVATVLADVIVTGDVKAPMEVTPTVTQFTHAPPPS